MAKIFISHTVSEEEYVRSLTNTLVAMGHEVVKPEFGAGASIETRLTKVISAVDVVIFLLSSESANRPWVLYEIGIATAYAVERDRPLLLPLVLGDLEIRDIPPPLHSVVAIKVTKVEELGFEVPIALARLLGQQAAKEEEKREAGQRVRQTAADFIKGSIVDLGKRERTYRRSAYVWYALGYVSLVLGAIIAFWRAARGINSQTDWTSVVQLGLLMLVTIGLLIALAKFSFILGKAFAVEALRNSDRMHAIRFGEFYLNAFPEKADWSEVKEVFQHWNIDPGSSFREQKASEFDPELIQKAIDLLRLVRLEGRQPKQ